MTEPLSIVEVAAKLDALLDRQAAPERRWLSIGSAATYADLSPTSVRRLLAAGKLQAYRPVRGRVLVDRFALDALIASSTATLRAGRGRR